MRALLVTLLTAAATTVASAQAPRVRHQVDDVDARTLTAEQIQKYAATYYPAIRSCYMQFGKASRKATGELALKVVIHRDGYVYEFSLDAPGVKGKHLRTLSECIRMQVLGWHFPVRRDFTTAILPYYFMQLDLPGAGPQYSCWNPRGCPEPTRPKATKTKPKRR